MARRCLGGNFSRVSILHLAGTKAIAAEGGGAPLFAFAKVPKEMAAASSKQVVEVGAASSDFLVLRNHNSSDDGNVYILNRATNAWAHTIVEDDASFRIMGAYLAVSREQCSIEEKDPQQR